MDNIDNLVEAKMDEIMQVDRSSLLDKLEVKKSQYVREKGEMEKLIGERRSELNQLETL